MIIEAHEDDSIYRVVTPSVSKGGKLQDFILLASRRRPCDSGYASVASKNQFCFLTFQMTK